MEKFAQKNKMFNGRQLFSMMIKHFETNSAADGIHDFELLLDTQLQGDTLEDFQATWDMVLLKMKKTPPEAELEMLYRKQIKRNHQFHQMYSI